MYCALTKYTFMVLECALVMFDDRQDRFNIYLYMNFWSHKILCSVIVIQFFIFTYESSFKIEVNLKVLRYSTRHILC